jgi:hypothetical protein
MLSTIIAWSLSRSDPAINNQRTPKHSPRQPTTLGNSSRRALTSKRPNLFPYSVVIPANPNTLGMFEIWGMGLMHQFNAGEVVTCISDMFLRHAAPGAYKVLARMPDRDGDRMYKIKSPLEEYERVVKETALVRSDCDLPEEILASRPRRRAITLASSVSI